MTTRQLIMLLTAVIMIGPARAVNMATEDYVTNRVHKLRAEMLVTIAEGVGATGISADDAFRLIQADSNAWLVVESGSPRVYVRRPGLAIVSTGEDYNGPGIGTTFHLSGQGSEAWPWIYTSGVVRVVYDAAADPKIYALLDDATGATWISGGTALPTSVSAYTAPAAGSAVIGVAPPITNSLRIATAADIDAATNHLIRTYLLSSNAWLSVSNETMRVYAATGGTAVASLIWESAESAGTVAADPAATNLLWQALSSGLATKAPKAWGQYAPDGSINPDPSFMTFINSPSLVIAGGATWATSGTYAVFVADGTVAFAGGTSGEMRIGPDINTNWFGYRQGGSVLVGARAASLSVHDVGTTNGYSTIEYDYVTGGDFPIMWFTPLLAQDFVLIEAVWADNEDGTATVTVPAQSVSGFYRATTTTTFSSYFVSTMPALLEGGVFGNTNAAPVIFDATITVSSGGKNYRIPAQEVK